MSFINFDPFKALSNKTGSIPQFELGKNFLFQDKLGRGDMKTPKKSYGVFQTSGRQIINTPKPTVYPPPELDKEPELDLDQE